MLEVNSSYQEFFASRSATKGDACLSKKASKLERTGFLPVELTDKCSTAEVMSDRSALPLDFVKNYTSQWLVNFGGRRPLTPFNSQQAELAKVK